MQKYIKELYKRKDLLIYLVTSGLKAQHRNTFFGYFWWLLDPLLNVLVYYLLVVVIFNRGGADYGPFLVIGMVVWRWISSTITTASKSIVSQTGIITQVYLPKAIFPFGAALTQLINFGFGLVVISIFLIYFNIFPGTKLLWLPIIILTQILFLTVLSLVVGFICVFIRDIDNLLNHFMRIWFYFSPVIWKTDMIPEKYSWILTLNPAYHFLTSYRNVLMYNSSPNFIELQIIGIISLIVIVYMIYLYSRHEHKIIKVL